MSFSIFFADYLGSLLALVATVLCARNSLYSWPVTIVTNIISLYLYCKTGIYGEAALQVLYMFLAFYGLFNWLYGGYNKQRLTVTNLPMLEAYILLLLAIVSYHVTTFILITYTNSTVPHLDAIVLTLSLMGQWLTSRKYIESWAVWFIVDCIFAVVCLNKQLNAHFVLNLIYLPIVFYGYHKWRNSMALKFEPVLL